MASAAFRTACKRLGGRAFRPALAAAAAAQQPAPSRLLHSKGLIRTLSSNVPALIVQKPQNFKKVHLEVSGRLVPVIGLTDMSMYKVSFCADDPDIAVNVVRRFMRALQSDRLEDLKSYLSHDVSIVEIKKIVGEGVMQVQLQSLEHTVEVKFELGSLKELVRAEGVSTRNEVKAVHKELTEVDFAKVVLKGCVVNCVFMLLVAVWGGLTFATSAELEMAMPNIVSA
ncbi:uncharacterized protein LOC125532177 [Triticum urartu]|uniref:uncharacterized protein LOC125527347 n=1 Tax=Triticum urartu TaxID=4572 RepID=UPI002043DD4C|nr:uncharacterized protein LOC125527347 [Triticum urartu]XP_048552288.1 uncharacterized protein LOC125532177 [Triticum urartu]